MSMLKSKYKISEPEEAPEEAFREGTEFGGEEASEEHAPPSPDGPPVDTRERGRRLERSEAAVRLQMLGKTADGDRYGYLKVVCTDMKLADISVIPSFEHLLFVNVSNNFLTLEDLQVLTAMPFLILIHADNNRITSAALKRMEYLQVIILNHNEINTCRDIYQPEMTTIEIGYNNITQIEFDYEMPQVRCLDLRYNKIKEITGITFAKLESLYLAGNKIKKLDGLETLTNLKILHLRNNPIKKLDGFSAVLKSLLYINLRNCMISTLKQIKKLKVLTGVKVLILKGTPYMGGTGGENQEGGEEEDDPEQRTEILAAVPPLQRINKTAVLPEEREEATEMLKNWLEEVEEEAEEEEELEGEEEGEEKALDAND